MILGKDNKYRQTLLQDLTFVLVFWWFSGSAGFLVALRVGSNIKKMKYLKLTIFLHKMGLAFLWKDP